jgi:transcriptional regulator with XRE-family HTH domain
MPAPTPERAGRQARPGARFLSDVLAANVRAHRLLRRLEQSDVAERMNSLGHPWVQQTVSGVERGQRNLTVDEILGLCLVFGAKLGELLDPTGPDGRNSEQLDYGPAVLDPGLAYAWLAGDERLELLWDGGGGRIAVAKYARPRAGGEVQL